ncbi:nitrate- and nitrite sensing domain-containing protein [Streptomyces sp. NPDC005805]|uniref:sensor histidine kinase n=1 Tax=Streptomyces sp. NPDC005805 TaxID=3157068 RepID=UPI0033CEBCF9
MRFRGTSIRRKIVALLLVPLLALTGLWGFATFLTGREAAQLLDATAVSEDVGTPVETVVDRIQQERRQTLVYLADRRASDAQPALTTRRAATDEAVATLRADTAESSVRDAMTPGTARRLTAVLDALDGMPALRRSVDANAVSRLKAMDFYNGLVDPAHSLLLTVRAVDDTDAEREGRALVGLLRAREILSREDALVASALTTRKVTGPEVRALTDLVAQRKLHYRISAESLPAREREIVESYWDSPETAPLREAEERLIAAGPDDGLASAEIGRWQEAAAPVLDDLAREAAAAGERHHDRIEPAAYSVFVRAGVAGVLGFLALLVSVVVSVRIGRELVRALTRLRKEAHEVAGVRLPSVMRRLAAGEPVDVETEAPRLEYGRDEIGQAAQALNTLQRAAVEAAVRQADMRRGVSEVFVNLARRNQVLLHRQLTLLDAMERRTEDTEELADLFRLDHLTTRMRRHAEGLVILSGAAPSRQWRKPIQLMDVVRAAVAEVEDYERIEVRRLPRIGVGGPAVADLTHLIAELLENATVFSPPHTGVQVLGERVANGFTLEIHDRGLGMTPDALLDANLRLAETPEFELSDTDRLGLFVVSRLAQRQNVRVSLQQSPYGGTTAVVFIPAALLTEAPETEGTGFRLDRRTDTAGRRGPGRLALSQAPPGAAGPTVLDGPVELEAPMGTLGLDDTEGRDRARRDRGVRDTPGRDRAGGDRATAGGALGDLSLTGLADLDDTESERGGLFRARSPRHETGTEPGEHRTPPSAGPPLGAVPLPRRRPPTLVSDHGRRVDDRGAAGRHHPAPGTGPATEDLPDKGLTGDDRPRTGPVPLARRTPTGSRARSTASGPVASGPAGDRVPDPVPLTPVRRTRPAPDRAVRPPGPAGARAENRPPREAEDPARPAAPAPGGEGLPRRVRQASLAPQLRRPSGEEPPAPPPAAGPPAEEERDAEAVRARMAAMQRGWQRGRRHNAALADPDDAAGPAPDRSADPATASGPARSGPAPNGPTDPATDDHGAGSGRTAPGTTPEGDGR